MKRLAIKAMSVILSAILVLPLGLVAFAAESDYEIISAYDTVDWDTWKAYKGNLHTHSTISDADTTMVEMVSEYYEQGFDFLAMSEHGVTGKAWNEKPVMRPLYLYQEIIGLKRNWLSDEQYFGMTSGTYPLASTGESRGTPMTCITGANELNAVTLTKSHVNGFFLPENVGNSNIGYENGFEYAIKLVDENGGLSHINHPGDWLESRDGEEIVSDPKNVDFFARLLKKYDTCLGMEVLNGSSGTTPYDRILWDNLLMEVIPYGRNVIGFANSDAHDTGMIDSTFSVFMMEENTVANIKATMQSGAFFGISRSIKVTNKIGPTTQISATNEGFPYPVFTKVEVSDHTISLNAKDFTRIQWIADGNIISEQTVTPETQGDALVLNLDDIEGSEDFTYVRAEIFGDGGMCFTQAFIIDDGTEPLVYEDEPLTFASAFEYIANMLMSTRLYLIFREIIRAIGNAID